MGTGKVIGWGIEGVYWGSEGKEFTRGCMSYRLRLLRITTQA